jgi:hypothetical protein
MPTGPEHYALSEGHLAQAREHHDVRPEESAWHQRQAAVHAELALVAWHAAGIFDRSGWMKATITVPADPGPEGPPRVHDIHGGPGEDCWCGYVGH